MAELGQVAGVLDPTALDSLREMVGGDDKFVIELIDTFLGDAPQMLANMRQAVENGDMEVLHRAAHSLKSNSAEFGGTILSSLCQELEKMSKAGMLEGAAERLALAEAEYEKVKVALEAVRG